MRVYHFVSQKYGIDDLKRRRLKVSAVDALNDPFEFLGGTHPNPNIRAALRMSKSVFNAFFGLICFSRNWTDPLQWSHYADSHRGLCLGFDVPDVLLKPVRYRKLRLKVDWAILKSGGRQALAELERLLTTKYDHWRYEEEVRTFVSLGDCRTVRGKHFLEFSELMLLREVIIGHRCTMNSQELSGLLDGNFAHVTVSKARMASGSFKMTRKSVDTSKTQLLARPD